MQKGSGSDIFDARFGLLFRLSRSGPANKPALPLHVVWKNVFGVSQSTPDTMYCLMGNGFFRAPTSANFGQLVSSWISKHPQAKVVPVETSGPIMTANPKSKQVYAWVVDGKDNLNEYLVRQGGCSASTMLIPDTSHYHLPPSESGHSKTLISRQEYLQFLKATFKAEGIAQKEKLGIWKNGTDIY